MNIFSALQWVDWVIAIVVLISTIVGLKRGFFNEALSLVIWCFAIFTSIVFHEQFAVLLQAYIDSASLRKVAAIASLFVGCLIIGGLVRLIVAQLIKMTGLTGTDRVLGMIFGGLRGVLIVVVMLMLSRQAFPLEEEIWWQESMFLPHFSRLESWTVIMATQFRDICIPFILGLV